MTKLTIANTVFTDDIGSPVYTATSKEFPELAARVYDNGANGFSVVGRDDECGGIVFYNVKIKTLEDAIRIADRAVGGDS